MMPRYLGYILYNRKEPLWHWEQGNYVMRVAVQNKSVTGLSEAAYKVLRTWPGVKSLGSIWALPLNYLYHLSNLISLVSLLICTVKACSSQVVQRIRSGL